MSELDGNKPTTMFWVVGVIALLWNLIGLWAYYTNVTATPDMLAALYDEVQIALIEATPAWATSMTAIAVTAGVLGSIFLLLRNKLCVPLFLVSLMALIVQDIYIFGMTDSLAVFGKQPLILQTIVFLIAVFLFWYSRKQKEMGVVR